MKGKNKWWSIEKPIDDKIDKALRKKVEKLYKFSVKHNLTYASIYLIDTEGSATINLRAKKGYKVIADSYAFVESRTKE